MKAAPALAPNAAMVLGIASTAMPFAYTPEAEAERWLRILRLHGEAGGVLQALGVGEGRLREASEDEDPERAGHERATSGPLASDPLKPDRAGERDPVGQVADQACAIASRRGASGVATTDLLLAVMRVYGADFDRVLQAHGTDRAELTERLGAGT